MGPVTRRPCERVFGLGSVVVFPSPFFWTPTTRLGPEVVCLVSP